MLTAIGIGVVAAIIIAAIISGCKISKKSDERLNVYSRKLRRNNP